MADERRSVHVFFYTTRSIREKLERVAALREWSLSQTCHIAVRRALSEWEEEDKLQGVLPGLSDPGGSAC